MQTAAVLIYKNYSRLELFGCSLYIRIILNLMVTYGGKDTKPIQMREIIGNTTGVPSYS